MSSVRTVTAQEGDFKLNINFESADDSETAVNVNHCSPAPDGTPTEEEMAALITQFKAKLWNLVELGGIVFDGSIDIDFSQPLDVLTTKQRSNEDSIHIDFLIKVASQSGRRPVYLNVPGEYRGYCFPGFKRGRCQPNLERQTYDDAKHRIELLELRADQRIRVVSSKAVHVLEPLDFSRIRSAEPLISHQLGLSDDWLTRTVESRKKGDGPDDGRIFADGPDMHVVFQNGRGLFLNLCDVNVNDVQVTLPQARRIAKCRYPQFGRISRRMLTLVKGPNDDVHQLKYVFEPQNISLLDVDNVPVLTVNATLGEDALPRVERIRIKFQFPR